MYKLKHTPGPLRIGPSIDNMDYAIMNNENHIIAETHGKLEKHLFTDAESNARLFAAAPLMLDCLIELYKNEFKGKEDKMFSAHATKQLIEKVTGQKIEDILGE